MTIREVTQLRRGDRLVLFSAETANDMYEEVMEAHGYRNDISLCRLANISTAGWKRNQDCVLFESFCHEGLAWLRFDFGRAYVPIEYIKCKL